MVHQLRELLRGQLIVAVDVVACHHRGSGRVHQRVILNFIGGQGANSVKKLGELAD